MRAEGLDAYSLTASGRRKALSILRAHRLWETYLSRKAGLGWDMLDTEAERVEHLLTPAMIQELDESLGRPATDPHGAPIPTDTGEIRAPDVVPLSEMPAGATCVIRRVRDEDPACLRLVKENGIGLGSVLHVAPLQPEQNQICVSTDKGLEICISRQTASNILVQAQES